MKKILLLALVALSYGCISSPQLTGDGKDSGKINVTALVKNAKETKCSYKEDGYDLTVTGAIIVSSFKRGDSIRV